MNKLVENPVLIGIMVVLSFNCYIPPNDAISQQERFIENHPTWKSQSSEILNKPVNNNINNMNDVEKISLVLMSIVDIKKETHNYNVEIKINSHEKDVLYCKKHFGYEIIRAQYNAEQDKYDYLVIKHKKQF
jgi:hypothetical protein